MRAGYDKSLRAARGCLPYDLTCFPSGSGSLSRAKPVKMASSSVAKAVRKKTGTSVSGFFNPKK